MRQDEVEIRSSFPPPIAGNLMTTTKKIKKRVHFSESDTTTRDTIHIRDMTDHERENYWTTFEEIRAQRMDSRGLIGMLNDGMEDLIVQENSEQDDVCLRGIESLLGNRMHEIVDHRKALCAEIFGLQAMFAHSGPLIAQASQQASEKQRRQAREYGIADEATAKLILHQELSSSA